jgi:hypothetical protein
MAPPFLTSALDGGEWSASHPGRFTRGDGATGTHWLFCSILVKYNKRIKLIRVHGPRLEKHCLLDVRVIYIIM